MNHKSNPKSSIIYIGLTLLVCTILLLTTMTPKAESVLGDMASNTTTQEQTEYLPLPYYEPNVFAQDLLAGVNQVRAQHGLSELIMDPTMCSLAYVRAQEVSVEWSHIRPNGQTHYTVYTDYGIEWPEMVGENLANYMLKDADLIVDSWFESEPHRQNILYEDYERAGMAVYYDGEKYYICNLFAT